jgi:acyl-coenzyme A synthetase/AMP-(fatty) acid ligase
VFSFCSRDDLITMLLYRIGPLVEIESALLDHPTWPKRP